MAQLNIVADFISRELTVEQVAILNSLIESAKSYDINGVPVVITTLAVPHYVQDLAILAHKIRDMEGLDAIFLVVQMGDKTHVIARSRVPVVNVGVVLGELGGGGHPTAASAVVRDMTHVQTAERLIELQSEIVTSALDDAAVQLQRIADTEHVGDLARGQAEVLQATRQRIVDDISRAMKILKGAAGDVREVATRATKAAATPRKKATSRASKRVAAKPAKAASAARKTRARARVKRAARSRRTR